MKCFHPVSQLRGQNWCTGVWTKKQLKFPLHCCTANMRQVMFHSSHFDMNCAYRVFKIWAQICYKQHLQAVTYLHIQCSIIINLFEVVFVTQQMSNTWKFLRNFRVCLNLGVYLNTAIRPTKSLREVSQSVTFVLFCLVTSCYDDCMAHRWTCSTRSTAQLIWSLTHSDWMRHRLVSPFKVRCEMSSFFSDT